MSLADETPSHRSLTGWDGHVSERRTLDFHLPQNLSASLPLLPLRRGVALPGGVSPFVIGRPGSRSAVEAAGRADDDDPEAGLILVGVQREPAQVAVAENINPIAVIGRIVDFRAPSGRPPFAVIQGLSRVRLSNVRLEGDHLRADFEKIDVVWPKNVRGEGLLRALRAEVRGSAALLGGDERVAALLGLPVPPELWVDVIAASLPVGGEWRLEYLDAEAPLRRGELLLKQLDHAREVAAAESAVKERIQTEVSGHQREAHLRQQLKAIQEELGGDDDQLEALKQRLSDLPLDEAVDKVVQRELSRLARLREGSPERSVAIDWLERIAELPWGLYSSDDADLSTLEAALDASHYGLEDLKRQVLEHLAVRELSGSGRADVLLLVGPPGVGKTSVGTAIAEATGRPLVRVALGGVRDEAELRGHRRTYIGARPGRIVEGIRRAGAADPVILLDEIDKLGRGWQGDPAAALLEILDPEQKPCIRRSLPRGPLRPVTRALRRDRQRPVGRAPGPPRPHGGAAHRRLHRGGEAPNRARPPVGDLGRQRGCRNG